MALWKIILFIFTLLIMFGGLLGTFLPVIPGVPIILLAAFVYAVIDGFHTISLATIAVFAILTGISLLLDYISMIFGIKKMGGSYFGVVGAFLGMIVGLLFWATFVGLIVGPLLGAIAFEMLIGRESKTAIRSGLGSFIGFLLGGVLKFAIGAAIIGIFAWKALMAS